MSSFLNELHFRYNAAKRFFKLLTRKKKNIKFIYIQYAAMVSKENGLINLRFKFRNAVWYKIGSEKTLVNTVVVKKPENQEEMLSLTVHGVFRKKSYAITLKPDSVYISREA